MPGAREFLTPREQQTRARRSRTDPPMHDPSPAPDQPLPDDGKDPAGMGAGSGPGSAGSDASSNDPEVKAAVQALVAACIEALERGETDPATRLCADRPELRTRVQRRLAQLASRGLIPDSEALPAAIGPYRILRELGSGGMGSVYLADQQQPIRRQVALKVVKLGMDTREVLARFQAERQALARMGHPHIAQVFDAGITGEGRPYFVMEYVPGKSLTSFCDQRQLSTTERVRLLATVCRAVQHAHDRGFIHRDLKPSNVLVSVHEGTFVPKIIDFGIAKAVATGDGDGATQAISLATRADQVLGTPEYMSPEQMASGGVDVDTRTDVYSLGVTLYELLCSELPFDSQRLRRAGRDELARILHDELPTHPSKRLSQVDGAVLAARGGERTSVQRAVAGELDWITLKAIGKQRDERYPSALAMAEDLERWLAHEPVLAAPPGRTYRLRKFVRRHRVAVGSAAVVLLSLVAALVVSLRATAEAKQALAETEAARRAADEALVATRAAEGKAQQALGEALAAQARESKALGDVRAFYGLARDAVGNLVDVADQQLGEVPQADAVRRRMLADAIAFYSALRARESHDPNLRVDLIDANGRIGELQMQLGNTDDALRSLRAAVDDAEALVRELPADAKVGAAAVMAHNRLGHLFTVLGRSEPAKAEHTRGLALLQTLRTLKPVVMNVDLQEARLEGNLANECSDAAEALEHLRRALAAFARAEPLSPDGEYDRARCRMAMAEVLSRGKQVAEAATELKAAAAELGKRRDATSVRERELVARVEDELASMHYRLGQRAEAIEAQQRSNDRNEQLAKEHPDVLAYQDQLGAGLHFLAQIAEEENRLDDALVRIRRAVALRRTLLGREPQNHRFAMRCARSILTAASIELQRWQRQSHDDDDLAAARASLAAAKDLASALLRDHGDDVDVLATFAAVQNALGQLALQEQRFDDAARDYASIREVVVARLAEAPQQGELLYLAASACSGLLQARSRAGDAPAAVAAGRAAIGFLDRALALDALDRKLRELAATVHARTALVMQQSGDPEGAARFALAMSQRKDLGKDCQEQGCLLLAQVLNDLEDQPELPEWREHLVTTLREIVTNRGDVAAAKQRAPQGTGFSVWKSRLRDFDLRLFLADSLGAQRQFAEQKRWLDEAHELAVTLPDLSADRWRNLTSQQAECLLAQEQPDAAVAVVEAFLARIGDTGGGNYLAACLLQQAREQLEDPDERDRLAAIVVRRIALALDQQEVRKDAAQHPRFDDLAGRPGFDELRRR